MLSRNSLSLDFPSFMASFYALFFGIRATFRTNVLLCDIAPFWVLYLKTHEFGDVPTLADGKKLLILIVLGEFQGLFLLTLSGFVTIYSAGGSGKNHPWCPELFLCAALSLFAIYPANAGHCGCLDTQLHFLLPERPRSAV